MPGLSPGPVLYHAAERCGTAGHELSSARGPPTWCCRPPARAGQRLPMALARWGGCCPSPRVTQVAAAACAVWCVLSGEHGVASVNRLCCGPSKYFLRRVLDIIPCIHGRLVFPILLPSGPSGGAEEWKARTRKIETSSPLPPRGMGVLQRRPYPHHLYASLHRPRPPGQAGA